MREKTKGIVLSIRPYNDKTSFVHVYTEKFGPVTYAVPNAKGKKSKLSRSLFMPLTVLNLEVEHLPTRDIHKIAEASVSEINLSIISDPVKSAIAIFLSEFLSKTIREHEPNIPLFAYLEDSIRMFNLLEDGKANFHILFLARISDILGLRIRRETYDDGARFNMIDGMFTFSYPDHAWYLSPQDAALLYSVLDMKFTDIHNTTFNREQRNRLLEIMLAFYKLHFTELSEIKSLDVLKTLFS